MTKYGGKEWGPELKPTPSPSPKSNEDSQEEGDIMDDIIDRADEQLVSDTQDEPERVISQFIALKFDVDTNEFSDGTLERWNNMLAAINAHTQQAVAKEQRKMRLARLMWKKEKAEAVLEATKPVREAFTNKGSHPDYHDDQMLRLKIEWPILYTAVRDLAHLKDNQEKG